MSDFSGLYDIRDGKEEDKSFILHSFLRGAYYGNSWFTEIPKHIFMENYKKVAEALINSPNTIIKVACLPDDKDVILGYSILSRDFLTVHFVYVKGKWRLNGIGRSLCPMFFSSCTHLTESGRRLMKEKFPKCVFNPFFS